MTSVEKKIDSVTREIDNVVREKRCRFCGNISDVIYRDGGSCSYCVGWDWICGHEGKVFPWNPVVKEVNHIRFNGKHASAKFFKDGTCFLHTEEFAKDDYLMRGATIKKDMWIKGITDINEYDSYNGSDYTILDKETVLKLRKPRPVT